ncbi:MULTISPECIES: hypothetical protein [Sorangium]|uniref:Lipid/polyisoprenoid-binding YceI-like domain-containing protein n=1 Tax=Sorangium cellulosum TaxID=56 RepID=A0A4P2QY66_SORCE|nr:MULTISPECIES: hypothetical protein [Sorangium]AUX35435.1 hypothetical protein SOCE836_076270 [Sorangium cellulosum]WCQ94739.1 hypothetical protein NQZ70_07508 [Sorangium sp. Soce836]
MKTIRTRTLLLVVLAAAAPGAAACQGEAQPLAPAATELKAPEAKAPAAAAFAIDRARSNVELAMDAPREKIRGRIEGAAGGTLQVDPTDITKTTGLITVDLSTLELFQTAVGDDGKPGEEKKSDVQNEHARTWLEISKDTPDDVREKNARAQFAIRSISTSGEKDLSKLSGAERTVTVTASGDLLLHQRQAPKTVELIATFRYEGDRPAGVTVKTAKPFSVGLAEHDVRPREAFGKLAQKTLEVLAPKVAKEAAVSLELTATAGAATPPPAAAAAPAGSAAR